MAEEKIAKKENNFGLDLEEMTKAGLYFGHRTSKINPKMNPYLQGVRNTVHIIDLEKTIEKLAQALEFIQELVSKNGVLLLVGTKIQHQELVESAAKECGLPYINRRWLGGTFTNFEVIKKRIDYFKDLEGKKERGELDKYTKKERIKIDEEIADLKVKFEGIKNLTRLPDAVFVCDMVKNNSAVKEARKKGVIIIGISDTNVDPTLADYPIPANDDAISSVKYILEKIKEVIKSCLKRN